VEQRDRLQRLSQAHFVCENGAHAVVLRRARIHAHHLLVQPLDALDLVRTQRRGECWLHDDVYDRQTAAGTRLSEGSRAIHRFDVPAIELLLVRLVRAFHHDRAGGQWVIAGARM